MVLLVMPEWAKAADAEDFEVDSWEALARRQLSYSHETWETVEEGDILAVECRDACYYPWPGNRRFVVVMDSDRVVLFDEHGAVWHDPDESPDGLVKASTFNLEFAGNNEGNYYRIPPASSLDPTTELPDFAAFSAQSFREQQLSSRSA